MFKISSKVITFAVMLLLTRHQTLTATSFQDTLYLTLNQALEIAFSESPTIRIADREITKQEYAKKGTYASLFPQVDFSGVYQRTVEKQTMYMDGMEDMGMSGGFKVGRDNLYSAGFSASMPLVSASLWKSLRISAYDVELSVEKARSSRVEMADQVKQAFYGVLLARDALNVFREAYDNALFNYNEIERKYQQGLLAEYDLIRANVNVKNAEPNVYDAENALILAHWQLKALLGLDLENEVVCVGELSDFEHDMLGDYLDTNLSLENNSTLKQMEIQHKQLQATKKMQVAAYYPTLGLQFDYQWISMNNDFKFRKYNWDPYSLVSIALTIPVFSGGGGTVCRCKKTQISIRQLEDQQLDTERMLNVAAKQYNDQMKTSIKQYQAVSAGVDEAEKSYKITMKRYETGEGTMLEINDAQLSLTQAQLNLNQSIYNYLIAKSGLERTLGQNPRL